MSKTYSSAPLPFMGQKRRVAAEFTQALKTFDNITTVVDLFGGSGLLSHLAKRTRPDLRVVYNDFDNYSRRLANIERTNALLNEIRDIVTDVPRDKRLPTETKDKVLRAMKQAENSGFVDCCTGKRQRENNTPDYNTNIRKVAQILLFERLYFA